MDTISFLRRILPATGYYVAARLVNKQFRNQVCETLEETAAFLQHYDAQDLAAYHACAAYRERQVEKRKKDDSTFYQVRVQTNVRALRSFWLDLDVDPAIEIKYPSQDAALDGLMLFCHQTGMALPMVVSSGGGIHCYWTLLDEISPDAWKDTAEGIKALCAKLNFRADPACTGDSARVLRPVGTFNRKSGVPVPVALIADDTPTLYANVRDIILRALAHHKVAKPETITSRVSGTEKLNQQFAVQRNYPPTSSKRVAERCQQIAKMRDTKGCVPEPVWYSGIQVMVHGVEGDELIHEWSNGYAGYSRSETDGKINQIRSQDLGPTLCTTFESRAPGGCDGCVFKGKLSTPAQLGLAPENAPAPQHPHNEGRLPTDRGPTGPGGFTGGTEVPIDNHNQFAGEALPSAPEPFARGDTGIWMTEEGVAHKVYPYDIYPFDITYDETVGWEVIKLRHWLPKEGWQECSIQSSLLARPTDFDVALRNNSIQPFSRNRFVMYMDSYIRKFRETRAMQRLFRSMGWKNDCQDFVVGDHCYRSTGDVISAGHSARAGGFLSEFTAKGSLATWRELTAIFNLSGLEPHAFMLLLAFVPPLLELGGRDGFTANALSSESGIGKSTMGKFVASVWGHPEKTWVGKLDTQNALIERLGAYSSIPIYMDEITTIKPEQLREIVYMMPTGKGRAALTKNRDLRESATWKTVMICSANDSLQQKLQAVKANAEAEGMRLFEFRFPAHPAFPGLAKQFIHPTLADNYGVAGREFIRRLVANRAEIKAAINPAVLAAEHEFGMQDKERFWSQALALTLFAGNLARQWGIIDFDPARIKDWLRSETGHMRYEMAGAMINPVTVLAEYLDAHVGERLVLSNLNQGLGAVHLKPTRGVLSQRLELDTKTLWVPRWHIKKWMQENNHNYTQIREELHTKRIILGLDSRCTLGKGTDFEGGSVPCWKIDAKHPDLMAHVTEGIPGAG